jgi:imidazolonepropionase-like amidohydrolase
MTRLLVAAVSALLLASSTASDPPVVAWVNGAWFDGAKFVTRDMYTVKGRLTDKRPHAVSRTVDLRGRFVTGAFAEAHNHNIPGPDPAAQVREYLQQGIYYVMIQANTPGGRAAVEPILNSPGTVDVQFANGGFTAPGGHPTALVERNIRNGGMTPFDRNGGFLHPVRTHADVATAWRFIREQKPDFIKIMLIYSEDRLSGVPVPADSDRYGLDPSLVGDIVRRAHADKLRVSAHVESARDFVIAVDAGADLIAHLPGFWPDPKRSPEIYRMTADSVGKAARRGVAVITTLGSALREMVPPAFTVDQRGAMMNVYRHNLELLRRHRVRIAIGSDNFRGTSVDEALQLHAAGLMEPPELLRALSIDGPAAVFPNHRPSGVEEGALADFLVLEGNPLEDFSAIRRIAIRVKAGEELNLVASDKR